MDYKYYLIVGILSVILLGILYLYLKIKYKEFTTNKKIKKQLKRGIQQEEKARKVLVKKGYKIISHNKLHNYSLKENGNKTKITVETDYIVYKNKKTYIVEVKTGIDSPKITNRHTRRQILEYYTFIKNDGVLLLNMENEKISEIIFPNKLNVNKQLYLWLAVFIELIIIAMLISYIFF